MVIARDCLVCETCKMPRARICEIRSSHPTGWHEEETTTSRVADNGYIVSWARLTDILFLYMCMSGCGGKIYVGASDGYGDEEFHFFLR